MTTICAITLNDHKSAVRRNETQEVTEFIDEKRQIFVTASMFSVALPFTCYLNLLALPSSQSPFNSCLREQLAHY